MTPRLLYLSTEERERLLTEAANSPAMLQLVADEATASCDAALFILTGPHQPGTRRRVAAAIMVGGLFVQAAYLGLVRCALCGDQGCGDCR